MTVTGVNDNVISNDTTIVTISVDDAASDNGYDPVADKTVAITLTDDEVAGITVGTISGNTGEDGTTATFTVVLNSQPSADVTIGISSSDTSEGSVILPTTITFTAVN